MRLHTISRATGRARIWEVGLAFNSQFIANAFDTDGAPSLSQKSRPLSRRLGFSWGPH